MQVTIPTQLSTWTVLLAMVLPIVAGALANLAMDGLKQLIPLIDTKLPDVAKKILSAVLALGVGILAAKFGVVLDSDYHLWTAGSLTAVFTVLVQQGIFRWKAKDQPIVAVVPPSDAAPVIASNR